MISQPTPPPPLPFLCRVPGVPAAKPIDSHHVERNLAINVIGLDLSLLAQLLDLNRMESVPICFWPLWLYRARLDGAREGGRDGGERDRKEGAQSWENKKSCAGHSPSHQP